MKHSASAEFQSDPEAVFLFKYWQALIVFAVAIGFAFVPSASIVVVILPALWGIFCLSAAEVKACDRFLAYRRFLKWREVPYEEIRQCKNSWIPGLAYFRLRRFVPPWGKIYFVIERSAFYGKPKELTAFINSRREGRETTLRSQDQNVSGNERKPGRVCALMGLVGIVYSFLLNYLFPNFPPQVPLERFPRWIAIFLRLWHGAVSWPWAVATMALLIALIFRSGLKNRAWILAWAIGALLGSLATRAFKWNL